MISEYALDPELLSRWESFRYFIEKFGVSEGRVIVECPAKWKRKVFEALQNTPDYEKHKIVERLTSIKSDVLVTREAISPEPTWLATAQAENTRRPFRAVISSELPPEPRGNIILGAEVDETHPLFSVSRTLTVPRAAAQMAGAIRGLLVHSRDVVFVDPHFRPDKPRFQRPLKAFIEMIRQGSRGKSVTLKYVVNDTVDCNFLNRQCCELADRFLPSGLQLQFSIAPENEMHDRFVLSELGGVQFGQGLDERTGDSTNDTMVSLLHGDGYREQWARWKNRATVFSVSADGQLVETN